jgi:hypothetical protein
MMRCPYCAEDIKDDAIVCKHCHRELFVVKPLLAKIDELSARVAQLEASATAMAAEMPRVERRPDDDTRLRHSPVSLAPWKIFVLCYLALVAAHYLIVVHYDLKLVYLKFASIAVPFVFGLICRESESQSLRNELVLGLGIAATAILTMLAVTARVANVPLLPRDAFEWYEVGLYSASIGFGFLTGVIVRHTMLAMYAPNTAPYWFIERSASFLLDQFGDSRRKFTLKVVRSMVSSILAFASAIVSILTGLWEYILKN